MRKIEYLNEEEKKELEDIYKEKHLGYIDFLNNAFYKFNHIFISNENEMPK